MLILIFTLAQCAKRGTPTGGEIDTEPPKYIRASPENYSTNFSRDEIRIHFDEYIKLEKPQEQLIISPPMDPKPEITPMGSPQKYIRIRDLDTLEENTTYVFNFGNSVVDNNEGNPLPFFKYVFSTGSYIDSLTVTGTVNDALLKEPESFISVMLYERDENFTDSLVYKQPPRYITNTLDSLKTFELTNLKEGTYQLVAIKDQNNNYRYDPGREKIAFIEQPITVPTDTTYNLVLFREIQEFQPERPKQLAGNKLLLGYRGRAIPDSLRIEPITPVPADFDYKFTRVPEKDSLHVWIKPTLELDSLQFKLISQNRVDTLLTRITEMAIDTMQITPEPSGSLDFGKNIILRSTTPLEAQNSERISVMDRDSVNVEFTTELRADNSVAVIFPKEESQTYRLVVLPGALQDFYGTSNDTIQRSFKTKAYSEYGNVTVNLQNVAHFPIIVQLTDEKGVVQAEKYSTAETSVRFDYLNPGKFLLRVIYDRNENGVWDTGNYLEKRPPEEIIYLPEVLDVRPNWDVNQPFIL
ncbi:MAG TPA: Ig-like domain-containing protein [Gillisia sp.]|nr:Ig-like domain-containing protein [Gillisia sp.]